MKPRTNNEEETKPKTAWNNGASWLLGETDEFELTDLDLELMEEDD